MTKILKDGFETYLRYKTIIEMISKKECTSKEIIKSTEISPTTVYGIIKVLLTRKVVKVERFNLIPTNTTGCIKERVYVMVLKN